MEIILDTVYNVITPIFLIIGLGIWFGRRFQPDQRVISSLIIYLFAPALVLEGITTARISSGDLLLMTGLVFGVSALLIVVSLVVCRLLGLDERRTNAFVLAVILFNGANYGIPFNAFAYGADAEQFAVVYYSISVMIANTIGVYFASRGSDLPSREAILNIFRLPLLYATILGVVFNLAGVSFLPESPVTIEAQIEPFTGVDTLIVTGESAVPPTVPVPLVRVIVILGDATIPAMLILIGVQLGQAAIVRELKPVFVATALTLLLAPLMTWGGAELLGMEGLLRQVGITQLAMPTAVIASALVTQFGGDKEFVASVTLVSTVASVLTLSILTTLL